MNIEPEAPKDLQRIPVQKLHDTLQSILLKNGFTEKKAEICAQIFVQNTCEGISSHGINRFPRFIQHVTNKFIDVHAESELKKSVGCIEQWDGHLGPGPLNALSCMQRAMKIASEHGIGCVGLSNTNHWMRPGYYARRAALEGYIFIGWTNTIANMPAWGARDKRLGNNPLVIGIPFDPVPLVLDMAMSQFSIGSMETKISRNEKLSVPGGFSSEGNLTDDPSAILSSGRVLPIGYWKGSGLALFLDILAVALSGGLSTHEISSRKMEYGVSQVYIAIPISSLNTENNLAGMIRQMIEDFKQSIPIDSNSSIHFPGENVERIRKENEKLGVHVDPAIWSEVLQLL